MDIAHLFTPLPLASGVTVPNRLVMAPMTTWSSHPDGTIHPDEVAYLRRRSDGPGMVMTAACYVISHGKAFTDQWGCHTDAMLPSLVEAREAIHAGGALAVLQLHHGGRMSSTALLGHAPVSASAVPPVRPDAETPRALTHEEVLETIEAFGAATRRAIAAGYDGVEIHGANTYLLQQFFSPHSNRRDDAWGGDVHARMRFPLAVVEACLEAARTAGRPFAVGYRLSPEEVEEPGITIDDTLVFADVLAATALDWLHVSTRDYRKGSLRDRSDRRRPTKLVIDAVAGRMPVIGVGLVYKEEDLSLPLEDGCAAVALGRGLLMDPDWVRKLREGRAAEIVATLPAEGGDVSLSIPGPMYDMIRRVKGWLPVG